MATTTRSIINLEDAQHPNLELSILNNQSPFFRVVPQEVRLMIYEFAVYVDDPIVPGQVKPHSNKFKPVTNRSTCTNELLDSSESQYSYVQTHHEFTNVLLARTCRAIYAELEMWCPFYKINTFEFSSQQQCHVFLAAITPQRRKDIRWINLIQVYFWPKAQYLDPNLLALLGTRTHKLDLKMDFRAINNHGIVVSRLSGILDRIKKCVPMPLPRRRGRHLLWDLPFLQHEIILPPSLVGHSNIVKLEEEITNAIGAYRQSINQDDVQWLEEIAKDFRLQEIAVSASKVHFPGEVRVTLNKESSFIGPVASRTRAKCQVPDSMGVVERTIPRYNEEGILVDNVLRISMVRWGETDVQCMVYCHTSPQGSWENLSSLLSTRHEYRLRAFYTLWTCRDGVVSGDKLDEMKAIPSPRDIFKMVKALWSPEEEEVKQFAMDRRRAWLRLREKWDMLVQSGSEAEANGKKKDGDKSTMSLSPSPSCCIL
ncbi:hypothetical protein F4781DRAFT_434359 [Annulohypoxylon bovei var. microspora]|nr:hypothetical protein F4781DRAFT_434359 [Annulohypoxylon bovei var. microspora]